jgi:hypothetical protein
MSLFSSVMDEYGVIVVAFLWPNSRRAARHLVDNSSCFVLSLGACSAATAAQVVQLMRSWASTKTLRALVEALARGDDTTFPSEADVWLHMPKKRAGRPVRAREPRLPVAF